MTKRESDSINKRSLWRVGQRVHREDGSETGQVVEANGRVKIVWESGRTSYFNHGDRANVEILDE